VITEIDRQRLVAQQAVDSDPATADGKAYMRGIALIGDQVPLVHVDADTDRPLLQRDTVVRMAVDSKWGGQTSRTTWHHKHIVDMVVPNLRGRTKLTDAEGQLCYRTAIRALDPQSRALEWVIGREASGLFKPGCPNDWNRYMAHTMVHHNDKPAEQMRITEANQRRQLPKESAVQYLDILDSLLTGVPEQVKNEQITAAIARNLLDGQVKQAVTTYVASTATLGDPATYNQLTAFIRNMGTLATTASAQTTPTTSRTPAGQDGRVNDQTGTMWLRNKMRRLHQNGAPSALQEAIATVNAAMATPAMCKQCHQRHPSGPCPGQNTLKRGRDRGPEWPAEEYARLRQENRCYNCRSDQHQSRDCPTGRGAQKKVDGH